MCSRLELKFKLRPENLKYHKTEVQFKLDESDVNKPFDEVLKFEDPLVIMYIATNSFHNGLIIGDLISKVNGFPVKSREDFSPILRGENCTVEVIRRECVSVVSKERLRRAGVQLKPIADYAFMVLNFTKPPNSTPNTQFGVQLAPIKNRALVLWTESSGFLRSHLSAGDAIFDFDGVKCKFIDSDVLLNEYKKFMKTGNLNVLIGRPATPKGLQDIRRTILTFIPKENDTPMATDAVNIGREASKMHTVIFRKLNPLSILKRDVMNMRKNRMKTFEEKDRAKLIIQTASAEMKIDSDVEDENDLKDVVKKSHVASDSDCSLDDE